MALANDSILVTPGSGATVATATPGGSNTTEYQVTIPAHSSGHLWDTVPTFILSIPPLDLAANRYHWELFNGSASTTTLTIRSIQPLPYELGSAGTTVAGFYFFRTTAISSGGTAGTYESLLTTAANIARLNPNDSAISSAVSAKTVLTSITTGSYLFRAYVSVSSTIPWMSNINIVPTTLYAQGVILPPAQGIAVRQSNVASSAQTLGWVVSFTRDT